MSRAKFERFKDAQIRPRCDWPATFSCNPKREVWPFITFGYTDERERLDLQGQIELLDDIVEDVLWENHLGGRFHINDNGAYLADDGPQVSRFEIR